MQKSKIQTIKISSTPLFFLCAKIKNVNDEQIIRHPCNLRQKRLFSITKKPIPKTFFFLSFLFFSPQVVTTSSNLYGNLYDFKWLCALRTSVRRRKTVKAVLIVSFGDLTTKLLRLRTDAVSICEEMLLEEVRV